MPRRIACLSGARSAGAQAYTAPMADQNAIEFAPGDVVQLKSGGPRDLARVGARLRHLAWGNEVLALNHQPTPGGDPQTGERSPALWVRGQRKGAGDCHGRRGEPKGQTPGPVAGVGRSPDVIA